MVCFTKKKINLPDRTSTPYSVCGNKNAAEQQQQGIPHREAGWCLRQDTEIWLGSVDSYTPSLLLGTSPISCEKTRAGKDRGGKKPHTMAARPYIISAAPHLFSVKIQQPSFPSWYYSQLSTLQQPQCLEPTIISVPVFPIVLWYPHPSLHQPFYYYLPSSFDLGALFQSLFQFWCRFILLYCPGYGWLSRTWREEAVLTV